MSVGHSDSTDTKALSVYPGLLILSRRSLAYVLHPCGLSVVTLLSILVFSGRQVPPSHQLLRRPGRTFRGLTPYTFHYGLRVSPVVCPFCPRACSSCGLLLRWLYNIQYIIWCPAGLLRCVFRRAFYGLVLSCRGPTWSEVAWSGEDPWPDPDCPFGLGERKKWRLPLQAP